MIIFEAEIVSPALRIEAPTLVRLLMTTLCKAHVMSLGIIAN